MKAFQERGQAQSAPGPVTATAIVEPAPTAILDRRPSKATADRLVVEARDYLVSVDRYTVDQLADEALDRKIRAALDGDPSMVKALGLRRLKREKISSADA